jgi:DNA-binding CsgD family transcriptional regulator
MRRPGETLYAVVSANGKMGGMGNVALRLSRGLVPLSVLAGVVVLVALGFGRGIWLSNLHNGLLALSFAAVGTYVSTQRPRNHAGALFLATGAVEAVLFFGRQVGHDPASSADRWWAWLGVWPLALALALTTLAIICFPTGRLPSPRWRPVAVVIVALASTCALLSALWPVEYQSAGVVALDPVHQETPAAIEALWTAVAHPTYIVLQLLWIVALASRWRKGDAALRSQLSLLLAAAAVSVAALAVGLIAFGTHVPGVLAATMVPIAAGWAIVHGRQLAAYRALSWLARTAAPPADLPDEMARTTAEALGAPGATLWLGDANCLHAAGVWPRTQAPIAALSFDALDGAEERSVRALTRDGRLIGALTVEAIGADALSRADARLLDDLAGQATWVVEHLTLAEVVGHRRRAGHLDDLTPREREVLELMAQGLTNRAICDKLYLSVKTVEPIVSSIFAKLDLPSDSTSNRRVLAVLAYSRR